MGHTFRATCNVGEKDTAEAPQKLIDMIFDGQLGKILYLDFDTLCLRCLLLLVLSNNRGTGFGQVSLSPNKLSIAIMVKGLTIAAILGKSSNELMTLLFPIRCQLEKFSPLIMQCAPLPSPEFPRNAIVLTVENSNWLARIRPSVRSAVLCGLLSAPPADLWRERS